MEDARTVDARADVYGLGMTLLFCLLDGKLPPRSPAEAIATLSCGDALKAALTKAIEVAPSARYADAGAFCAALRAAEDRATPPGTPARLALAHEFGEDLSGWYMSFKVGPAVQRLRWVPPATFVMGSPKSEVGRYDIEGPPREVNITEGYWLAETPCAQALWEAVMGNNPSRFKSPDRPVEQVSWEDCQRFLERLNERVPGLGARLPTEAEWERACRAGTTGATWVGELDVRGENNAPVLDAIAWYSGNSGQGFELKVGEDSLEWREKQHKHKKAGTRPVAKKAPNPLGLYDMLGNVWEWCEDWYAAYGVGPAIDPRGPATGTRRVARGGAWVGPAKFVRAAHRESFVPSNRSNNLGFRLARGQGDP
jgi:formylglycine-generating enzyme required for sulfatase activity